MAQASSPIAEIGLLVYPDCQLSAVYGLTDLFRIAGEWSDGSVVRVSHWHAVGSEVICKWDSHSGPHKLSFVISPPSIVMPESMVAQPAAAAWMRAQHSDGATLCSVCAGAFVLAETGLIDGRNATTHWAFADQLAQRFPKVRLAAERLVLDEGDIVTAGGILAWTDLGLTLVERLLGASVMLATARFLLTEPPRSSQRPYTTFIPRFEHSDDGIRRAQHYIHAHAAERLGIGKLHTIAGMTERTFLRRFHAATGHRPNEYLQQVRVAKAQELLEQTTTPVDSIAWQTGYSDPSAFRKAFQKFTGLAPASYRMQFGVSHRRGLARPAPSSA